MLHEKPDAVCGDSRNCLVLLAKFHPNEGKEEHYNLNGGRPREAAEFETFARAMESGDQELCTRMQDTSIAVSRVLTVARRSAGIRFPGER